MVTALVAAGCVQDGRSPLAYASARNGTVAFESIDGPPAGVFQTFVQKLEEEAQARQVPVVSREGPAQYRVRGYFAAHIVRGRTAIAWVWDVYDADQRRALRITGEEATGRSGKDAWAAADDQVLRKIARSGMDRLVAFLATGGEGNAPAAQARALGFADEGATDPFEPPR